MLLKTARGIRSLSDALVQNLCDAEFLILTEDHQDPVAEELARRLRLRDAGISENLQNTEMRKSYAR